MPEEPSSTPVAETPAAPAATPPSPESTPTPGAELPVETPKDPLADLSDKDLEKHPRVKGLREKVDKDAYDRGFRKGQGDKDSARVQFEREERAKAIYTQVEDARVRDPIKFAEMMADPAIRNAWTSMSEAPVVQQITRARVEGSNFAFSQVHNAFRRLPELNKLSDEDWEELDKEAMQQDDLGAWAEHFVKKAAELGLTAREADIKKEAESGARTKLLAQLREAGIDPSVLETQSTPSGSGGVPSQERLESMSWEEYAALPADTRKALMRQAGAAGR